MLQADLGHAEGDEQAVAHKLNVLLHQHTVHAQQPTGQRLRQKLHIIYDNVAV